jgi:PAS domain-containing protein
VWGAGQQGWSSRVHEARVGALVSWHAAVAIGAWGGQHHCTRDSLSKQVSPLVGLTKPHPGLPSHRMSGSRLTTALVRWQPAFESADDADSEPPPVGMLSLLSALRRLAYRGSGPAAWAAPLADDPIAFLLDSTSDAILVWSPSGRLLYANRAAEALNLRAPAAAAITSFRVGDRVLERRSLHFTLAATTYAVEIVRGA